jgi:hypothetical protein
MPSGAGLRHPSLPIFVGPMLLIWAVIWYLVSRLAEVVRRRDRELAVTNRRLEASGEERARHMLQTTHQLKAPFAAIHAQTQLLLGGYCGALPARGPRGGGENLGAMSRCSRGKSRRCCNWPTCARKGRPRHVDASWT